MLIHIRPDVAQTNAAPAAQEARDVKPNSTLRHDILYLQEMTQEEAIANIRSGQVGGQEGNDDPMNGDDSAAQTVNLDDVAQAPTEPGTAW